ncbi:MAG: ImmA/IrrE family metallo-endopeptidase [Planctomycetes bacterium]|nr:ImmA/IrrE family metallo-endopeptidase [Planctomycetota bacterium]
MVRKRRPTAIPYAKAEQLWRTFRWTDPKDLNLEDLAMALGALVVDGALQSAEARLTRKGDRGIIRIRKDLDPPGRRRFAIGHELGHWQLHRNISQIFVCTEADMIANYRRSRIEAEANSFASALLMPERMFVSTMHDSRPTFAGLYSLEDHFDTSLTATAIRWVDLARDYCAVVVSIAGKIKWWRGSEDFEDAFWISAGDAVSRYAGAYEVGALNREAGPKRVTVDTWAEKQHPLYIDEFIEASTYFPRYKFVMSLLSLP